eukprot:8368014-Pyramimonas_sp.AAC.1
MESHHRTGHCAFGASPHHPLTVRSPFVVVRWFRHVQITFEPSGTRHHISTGPLARVKLHSAGSADGFRVRLPCHAVTSVSRQCSLDSPDCMT